MWRLWWCIRHVLQGFFWQISQRGRPSSDIESLPSRQTLGLHSDDPLSSRQTKRCLQWLSQDWIIWIPLFRSGAWGKWNSPGYRKGGGSRDPPLEKCWKFLMKIVIFQALQILLAAKSPIIKWIKYLCLGLHFEYVLSIFSRFSCVSLYYYGGLLIK